MAEYAPSAIKWLAAEWIAAIGSAAMSGIVGDRNHRYGYHRARAVLPPSDYSVRLADDRAGDAWAASALDIKMNAAAMATVTARLRAAALDPDDDRPRFIREFYGTLDGRAVFGLTHDSGGGAWRHATSDNTHLWHVHISFFRRHATSMDAMRAVLSIITGSSRRDDDMNLDDKIKLSAWIPDTWPDLADTISVRTALGSGYGHARQAKDMIRDLGPQVLAGQAAILAAVAGDDVAATVRAELDRAAERERAERQAERAELVDALTGSADEIAAAVAAALPDRVDVTALAAALGAELGRRLSE